MTYSPTPEELEKAYAEEPFSVFSVTRISLGPLSATAFPAMHPTFLFTLTGHAHVEVAGFEAVAERGVVVHAAGPQIGFATDDAAFECIAVAYVAGRRSTAGRPSAFDSAWTFRPSGSADIAEQADQLERLGISPDLESRLNQIIGATSFIKGMFAASGAQNTPEGLRRAKAYMDSHYAEPLTLERLGSIAGLSPKRFSERFTQAFGNRPLAYLIETRVRHATELLATDMLIKDIARTVGYDDQFYFSRIYKKYRGKSPEAARRELQARQSPIRPTNPGGGPAGTQP